MFISLKNPLTLLSVIWMYVTTHMGFVCQQQSIHNQTLTSEKIGNDGSKNQCRQHIQDIDFFYTKYL